MSDDSIDITKYLELAKTEEQAMEELFRSVQNQFKQIAWRHLSKEGYNTLQATCLSDDAFFQLMQAHDIEWESREQFFAAASKVMRRILIDHYRRRTAKKRGGIEEGGRRVAPPRIPLNDPLNVKINDPQEAVALHEIVDRLASEHQDAFIVFNLHFYMGCQQNEITEMLEISNSTVKRRWSMATAYIRKEWTGEGADNE
ncbi:RNA polymerase sigma factor SigY [Gimesia alba]|uniref:RNA polymerase sigma factor SigY n=1 Tax=Gimesia alba TaxID=2527973 RepID=A0A517RHZ3_9PLAN|nr:ECF-type sigma factor [Gimesia alba]QDT43494.1 RNA polymerase sigma factor SigY [Gimesia alba]